MPKYRKKPLIVDAVQWNGPGDPAMDEIHFAAHGNYYYINTLEGPSMMLRPGDMIITGVVGEKYPCGCEVFDASYERVEDQVNVPVTDDDGDVRTFTIGTALAFLNSRTRVSRLGWNGPGQYLKLKTPYEAHHDMTRPYIYITTVQGDRIPWLASQSDMLADDWYALKEQTKKPRTLTQES